MLLVLLSLRNLQGFQEPCARGEVKDKYQNKRRFLGSYHLGNYKGCKSSVPGTRGTDRCIFPVISQPGVDLSFIFSEVL